MSWGPRVVAQQVTQLFGEQTRLLALEKAVGGYQQGRARFGVEWRHIVCRAADPAEVAVLLLAAAMVAERQRPPEPAEEPPEEEDQPDL